MPNPAHQRPEAVQEILAHLKKISEDLASPYIGFTRDVIELERYFTQLEASNARYVDDLTKISKNTCCDKCQEASLVARAALQDENQGGKGK